MTMQWNKPQAAAETGGFNARMQIWKNDPKLFGRAKDAARQQQKSHRGDTSCVLNKHPWGFGKLTKVQQSITPNDEYAQRKKKVSTFSHVSENNPHIRMCSN